MVKSPLGVEQLGLGREHHLQPLRHEIGDVEADAAHGVGLGIDIGRHLPAAMRRGVGEHQMPVRGTAVQIGGRHHRLAEFDAVGPRHHSVKGALVAWPVSSRSMATASTASPGR